MKKSLKYFIDFTEQTVLTEDEKKEFKPIPTLLKKGEASFHTGMAVHGSYGNK